MLPLMLHIIYDTYNVLINALQLALFAPLLLAEEGADKHGGFGHATDGHGHAVHHAGLISNMTLLNPAIEFRENLY